MWVDIRRAASILLVAAAALAGGCATVVKGTTQEISVATDPAGAACELKMAGASLGSIGSTPGTLQVKKGQGNIEVFCKKAGYADASGTVSSSLEGWTFGNILLGGVIGVVIDASSGALHEYESEIYVKLTPDKFASQEERESFLDKWRSDILRNSAKAKIAASKQCSQEQCDEMLKQIDQETERALAAIETNRNPADKGTTAAAPTTQGPSSTSQPSAQPPAAASVPAVRDPRSANAGDRWRYKLLDGKRPVGFVNVEVLDVRGYRVKERLTREGYPGFIAERQVDATFNPAQFQEITTLPGGHLLAEIAPYFPGGSQLEVGKRWQSLGGSFFLPGIGPRQYISDARVVTKEMVRVPAGEFEAWRIETVSEPDTSGRQTSIKCTFWYSPAMQRTVKMSLYVDSILISARTDDTYELVAFEPAN
jgi:hypothetical protein